VSALADRLRLLVVTEPLPGAGRTVLDVVRAALRGGATAIQLRDKTATARESAELARRLREETLRAGVLLFVNDRVDVALAAGADGAHLGDEDLPLSAARRIVPPGFILGASADNLADVRAAAEAGADYVGVGPVFLTGSKPDAGEAIGVQRIARVAAGSPIPVVGIGGITAGNAGLVTAAGAAGVAAIAAVMRAPDPEAAARALVAATGPRKH